MKRVSVIVPAFNRSDLTVRTIKSILDQRYENIEVLVVDDGSTDDTAKKLEQFGSSIIYLYKINGGACSARNLGIKNATGDYLAFIDCDDIYYDDKVSKCVEYLEKRPSFGFVQTAIHLIDDDDKVVGSFSPSSKMATGWIAEKLILGDFISNPTVIARKECFDNVGLFDESIFMPADWDMWLRMAEKYQAGYINEPLSGYRITNGYTIAHLQTNLKEEIYVLEKTFKRGKIKISRNLKRKSYANMYYRIGKLYGAGGDIKKSHDFFQKAIKLDLGDIKIIVHFLLSMFWPGFLERDLKRRYHIS
jgi:glycosyltransferase involved in cell wall biosynthesis